MGLWLDPKSEFSGTESPDPDPRESQICLLGKKTRGPNNTNCLAKAVHSLVRIRIANCRSVRPSVRPCLVRHVMVIALQLVGPHLEHYQGICSSCANRNIFSLAYPPEIWGTSKNPCYYYAMDSYFLVTCCIYSSTLACNCHLLHLFLHLVDK